MTSPTSVSGNVFNKNDSQALKGIAIIMMMFFHCFRTAELFKNYTISFFPFPEYYVIRFIGLGKICVSIFAFISGYGLFLSYDKRKTTPTRWALSRYVKTFSGFWFVYFISVVVNLLIHKRFFEVYFKKGICVGLANVFLDFFGLANLFKTKSLNGTWWYMSAAFVFILLMVLIYRALNEKPAIVLLTSMIMLRVILARVKGGLFTGGNSAYAFIPAFLSGALFAKKDLLNKWANLGKKRQYKIIKLVAELLILAIFSKLYVNLPLESFWEFHYCIFPLVFILFCVEFIIRIRFIRSVLAFCGKHSMNIFLVHTYIRAIFLQDLTYSFKHFVLVALFLLTASLVISIILEFAKKHSKYNDCIDKLVKIIEYPKQDRIKKA